jgi:Tol biopolymer transport system component
LVKELGADPENLIVIPPPIEDSSSVFDAPSISGDGCRVAFEFQYEDSSETYINDVYLYDCDEDRVYLISEAFNGTDPGNGFSFGPAISDDGNFVAFYSKATDLVDEALTGKYRIYVRDVSDLTNPDTELIPLPEGYDENVGQPSISADGRYVAYSYGDSSTHIFVYDRQEGVTKMVSPVDIEPESPSISADGRYVAFSGWIYEDTTWFVDIYVHDLHTGQTKLVTRGFEDSSADENAGAPKISADGRFVAFWSEDAELVVDDENESRDVFVYVNEPALNIEIIGAGTVSKMPNESTFDFDTVVVLTPIAGANAVFDGWTGLDVGELIDNGDGTWSITMDTDKVITANFLSSGHTLFLPMIVR